MGDVVVGGCLGHSNYKTIDLSTLRKVRRAIPEGKLWPV